MSVSTQVIFGLSGFLALSSILSLFFQSYSLAWAGQNQLTRVQQPVVTFQFDNSSDTSDDEEAIRSYPVIPDAVTLTSMHIALVASIFTLLSSTAHVTCSWYLSKRPDIQVRTRTRLYYVFFLFATVLNGAVTTTAFIVAQRRARDFAVDVSQGPQVDPIGKVGLQSWVCYLSSKYNLDPLNGEALPHFDSMCKISTGAMWVLLPIIVLAGIQTLACAWAWCLFEMKLDRMRLFDQQQRRKWTRLI